jgi:hypothetical protein
MLDTRGAEVANYSYTLLKVVVVVRHKAHEYNSRDNNLDYIGVTESMLPKFPQGGGWDQMVRNCDEYGGFTPRHASEDKSAVH